MRRPGSCLAVLLLSGCHLLLPLGSSSRGADSAMGDHPAPVELAPADRRPKLADVAVDRAAAERSTDRRPAFADLGGGCTATSVPASGGLQAAASSYSSVCRGASAFNELSLYAISCSGQPALVQVAAAVLAAHQTQIGSGAAITPTDLLSREPFSGCGVSAAKTLLDAIDNDLQETNPLIWFGDTPVPPLCGGCTSFQQLALLYYAGSAQVVALDGQYSY
jgi:hypothetical protein